MGWAVGFDSNWNRDIGYGVPAICDHPKCEVKIDRGLGFVCGGDVRGGEHGCGLFFCWENDHLYYDDRDGELFPLCSRCREGKGPFLAKHDTAEWENWKLDDPSWAQWRNENPAAVRAMAARRQSA